MRKVKIFGIQRSGTNYLESLLNDNVHDIKVFTNCFGWKHGEITDKQTWWANNGNELYRDYFENTKDLNYIVIIKNPYTWKDSIERWHKRHTKVPFDIQARYEKYNTLYKSHMKKLKSVDKFWSYGMFVRYEDLLECPEKELERICKFFEWKRRRLLKVPKKVYMSPNFSDERCKQYLKCEHDLTNEEINVINKTVKVFKYYGYAKIKEN